MHKDVFTAQRPWLQLSQQGTSDLSFAVMSTLVRCIKPAESHPERLRDDVRGSLLLPGCSIEERWHRRSANLTGTLCHYSSGGEDRPRLPGSTVTGLLPPSS